MEQRYGAGVLGVALTALLSVCLGGCSGPEGGPADGAVGDAASQRFALAPDIPWLADGRPPIAPLGLVPCPEGWTETTLDGGELACEPFGPSGPETCAEGEAHFPGGAGCERLGPACPVDGLPAVAPADEPAIYVLAGAPPNGADGTRASPYPTLNAFSWGALSAGQVVAVGVGTYEAVVRFPAREMTLLGACVTGTMLQAVEPDDFEAVVNSSRGPAHLRQLTVVDSERQGVVVRDAGVLSLEDVVVRGVRSTGVNAFAGGQLRAERVVIEDTRGTSGGRLGRGLSVQGGASAQVSRALFLRNREAGVVASDAGTSLTLEDVVVRDTQSQQSDRQFGRGLSVVLGASAQVSRALFSHNRDVGVATSQADTSLTLEDVVVRDTQSRESDGTIGRGLNVQFGASAQVSGALFSHNRDTGAYAGGAATSLMLEGVIVRDTQSQQSDGTRGRGLGVVSGASAQVSRALFSHNRDAGVVATDADTTLALEDVVVRDTQSRESDGQFGAGLGVNLGASAQVSRALFSHNGNAGVLAGDAGTRLTLEDVVVRDTRSRESDGQAGRGLNVQEGASAQIGRALFSHNRDVAVFAGDPATSLTLEDTIVRDTWALERDGSGGRALNVQFEASLLGARLLIERSHDFGVASLFGATVELSDIVIHDSGTQPCTAGVCVGESAGTAVISLRESSTSLSQFEVDGAERCGVHVAGDSRLDVVDGQVRHCAIGACVQVDGYDLERLTHRMRYLDNETNLQATNLPVPEPSAPIDTPRRGDGT